MRMFVICRQFHGYTRDAQAKANLWIIHAYSEIDLIQCAHLLTICIRESWPVYAERKTLCTTTTMIIIYEFVLLHTCTSAYLECLYTFRVLYSLFLSFESCKSKKNRKGMKHVYAASSFTYEFCRLSRARKKGRNKKFSCTTPRKSARWYRLFQARARTFFRGSSRRLFSSHQVLCVYECLWRWLTAFRAAQVFLFS